MEEKAPEYFKIFIPGDHLHRMLVAKIGGEVVAYTGAYPFSQRKAYSQLAEMMVYVHPAWQRMGFDSSSALLAEIHKDDFLAGLYTRCWF
jgi:L-amino acid N-acyltransferase YncA